MALYLIGDIQGCYSELRTLLDKIAFDPKKDQLWAVGDIIARGNDSLATIRYLKSLGDSFNMVLGNHDLHLLAVYHGLKKVNKLDKLEALLAAPDLPEIVDWLRKKPLLLQIPNEKAFVSHAGISPQWTIKTAIKSAKFAEKKLQSKKYIHWLTCMYGEQPNNWHNVETKEEKFRFIINTFTRMRFCFTDGTLEFKSKHNVNNDNKDLVPWFNLSTELKKNSWVFGHWASLLGKCNNKNTYALDTGCVWGNHLTILRWQDKKLFTEQAQK